MNNFDSIDQLNNTFTKQELHHIPSEIVIGEIPFVKRESLIPTNMDELFGSKKLAVLYSAKANSSDKRLILVWKMTRGLTISPLVAKLISKYRTDDRTVNEATKTKVDKEPEPVIGAHIEVVLNSFNNSKPIRGKVDTGATVCSLDASNINVRKDPYDSEQHIVDFTFEGTKYSVGLAEFQSVQSASGGMENRPVVSFTVKCEGKTIPNVLFNLNDRSGMEDKILVGMNLLNALGIKIDPKKESFEDTSHIIEEDEIGDMEYIMEQIDEIDEEEIYQTQKHEQYEKLSSLYEYLLQQNIPMSELLHFVKEHTITIIEKMES
jgi:hypothetical protein